MTMYPVRKILNNKKIIEAKGKNFKDLLRPSRKKTRLFIDNEYFEKGYAKLFPRSVLVVYCILAKYANYETQICFPSIDTVMRESGIRRRNAIINALKILEASDIIHIEHSRGRSSNQYALLSSDVWKEPNSINFDTVLKTKKRRKTVSKNELKQYQNRSLNSISSDTGNHIIKSFNKIMEKIKKNHNTKTTIEAPLSEVAFLALEYHYQNKDILQAISSLREAGKEISFRSLKDLLKLWSENGKIVPIKDMKW